MESVNELFLQALRSALKKETVDWVDAKTPEQWQELFRVASAHRVLPMIYDAVIHSRSADQADRQLFAMIKNRVRQNVILQTVKTNAFLQLLPELVSAGVTPIVVKGIICRELYPNPDYRMSSDEDVLIPAGQFALCHETLLSLGMELTQPQQDLNAYEVPYIQKGTALHIELHKHLFPPESDAYGEFNQYFQGVYERSVTQIIQGIPVGTLEPTDHLFYLICHSFKHFLHSGFGIRQVCDICLYANAFGAQIDWFRIREQCAEIHAELFAAALFRIGEKYLTFQPDDACYPAQWRELPVNEIPMLEDLLDSGVFGASSMSRKHSSNMTLHAVTDRKQGGKGGNGVLKTIFPSVRNLSGRYPYLKEKPFLLPVAWADRIVTYSRETAAGNSGNSAAESVRIGNERIELLKLYGVI